MRYEIAGAVLGAILFAVMAMLFAKGWLILLVAALGAFVGAVAGYRFVR